jgi:hypothetical protein
MTQAILPLYRTFSESKGRQLQAKLKTCEKNLHAEGWSNTAISEYLRTPRHRVYEVLKRWAMFGHKGLEDIPNWHTRKAGTSEINEVGKLVKESPELGAYRVRAALEQIGIHLSQATCGRLLALNRKLYGVSVPKGGAPREPREMPFKSRFRHEIWSVDVRYIEDHGLGFPEPIYMISILDNYSRALLSSKISPTQNQWDYLEVLFAALVTAGAPTCIVSDGGSIFRCNQAMDVYAALGIRKEQIEKRQAWQNYIESQAVLALKNYCETRAHATDDSHAQAFALLRLRIFGVEWDPALAFQVLQSLKFQQEHAPDALFKEACDEALRIFTSLRTEGHQSRPISP